MVLTYTLTVIPLLRVLISKEKQRPLHIYDLLYLVGKVVCPHNVSYFLLAMSEVNIFLYNCQNLIEGANAHSNEKMNLPCILYRVCLFSGGIP